MQDSSNNAQPSSTAVMIFLFLCAANVMQFFMANDGIRNLETELKEKDHAIAQLKTEKSTLEGKLQGYIEGRR